MSTEIFPVTAAPALRTRNRPLGEGCGFIVFSESASVLIDGKINELRDWRGTILAKVRAIIHAADPDIIEEWSGWEVQCGLTTESSW